MFELGSVAEFVQTEQERALAVLEVIAGVGGKIPEYLLEMYWTKVPCDRSIMEGALGLFLQLGLLHVDCTCTPSQQPFCLLERSSVKPVNVSPDLEAVLKENVACMRETMYAIDMREEEDE